MEKAIERQRVLLHHLQSSLPLRSPILSVSSLYFWLCLSRSVRYLRQRSPLLILSCLFSSSSQSEVCAAGDSAKYQRSSCFGDDVVIVAQCSSGLQAVADVAAAIKAGFYDIVGVEPGVMGIGPAVAIPAAVRAAGLQPDDIDIFEINELELDPEKVNVNGGAIALGHPLGATGARCVSTLLNEMKRRGKDCRFGVISMCIGEANTLCLCPSSGMGAAAVFERGDVVDQLINARQVEANSFLSKDAM
ncbi:hypothetical protein BHM03_00037574 [Ensete ventricosum]|nr:hypothetical protein BHM03_00037574 [Ensete ventricosum]